MEMILARMGAVASRRFRHLLSSAAELRQNHWNGKPDGAAAFDGVCECNVIPAAAPARPNKKKRCKSPDSCHQVYHCKKKRMAQRPSSVVWFVVSHYCVTLSSHLSMPSMMDMEARQIRAKTPQVIHWCGNAFNILTPRKMNKLPMAVADSHKPWHLPTM